MKRPFIAVVGLFLMSASMFAGDQGQLNNIQRDRVKTILEETLDMVQKKYFDPNLHGIDMKQREQVAAEKIGQATSYGAAFGQIAWMLDALDDSHTAFLPPDRPYRVEDGWTVRAVGDHCLFMAVRPDSDAAAQGIKPGDELLALDGFRVNPEILHKLLYTFDTLAPRSAHEMYVVSPGGQPRKVVAKTNFARLTKRLESPNDFMELIRNAEINQKLYEAHSVEIGDVMIFKLPEFSISDGQIEDVFKKAQNHKTLIIDLRDNPGGAEDVLTNMLGHLFDHEVKIGERIARKDKKPLVAKPRGHQFTGKVVVLVDSGSASSSEIFARTVQLEKRGIVIGDRSAGKVREAMFFPRTEGIDTVTVYALEISVSDLIMGDGKSLEHNPVVPDEIALPTPDDLRAGRDPVLAHAVEETGGKMTPEEAGKLFPFVWRKV